MKKIYIQLIVITVVSVLIYSLFNLNKYVLYYSLHMTNKTNYVFVAQKILEKPHQYPRPNKNYYHKTHGTYNIIMRYGTTAEDYIAISSVVSEENDVPQVIGIKLINQNNNYIFNSNGNLMLFRSNREKETSYAELSESDLNQYSHRGKLLLKEVIKPYINSAEKPIVNLQWVFNVLNYKVISELP